MVMEVVVGGILGFGLALWIIKMGWDKERKKKNGMQVVSRIWLKK